MPNEQEIKIARAYNLLDAWILLQRLILTYGRKSELTGAYHTNDIFVRCESCVDEGLDKVFDANRVAGQHDLIHGIIKLKNSFTRAEQKGDVSFSVTRMICNRLSCTIVVSHGEVTITLVSGIQRASSGSAMMMRALTEVIAHVVPDVYSMAVRVNLMITDLFEDEEGAATWATLDCCRDMISATDHELTEGL